VPVWIEPAAILGGTIETIIYLASVIGALIFLWKVVVPLAKIITVVNDKVVPNVQYMPHLAKLDSMEAVLDDIGSQFSTDSGSTLKDDMLAVRRDISQLGEYAKENRAAAADAKAASKEVARVAVETAKIFQEQMTEMKAQMGSVKELASDDRAWARKDSDLARDTYQRMAELVESALRTEESGARQEASGALADESRARTEASGARIEEAGRVVAEDLAAKTKRADDVDPSEPHGAASDAAAQSPDE
jgi:hypothetical protein